MTIPTDQLSERLIAAEAELTRVAAERTQLHRLLEKLSCRLELLEHHQRRRTLLATLAMPTDASDEQALRGLAGVGWEIG